MSDSGLGRGFRYKLWLLPLVAAGFTVMHALWSWALQAPHLPRWDMAKYGAAASRMQQAMEALDPWALLQEIHQLSSWPFVVPLMESVVFLVWGNGFEVSRALMVVLYGLSCVLATYLTQRLGDDALEGTLLAWWTLPILLTSPMLHLYGVLNMLEMPGTLLTLLCLVLYDRAVAQPQRPSLWWALGVASCLLFFCKYNYGLMWLAALGLAEVRRRCGSWRSAGVTIFGKGVHRHFGPWQIFVAVVLALLAWIRLRGGLELQLGSVEIRATSIGNPVYGLLILQVGRVALRRDVRRRALHRWHRGALSSRILGWSLGLPILLWMLVPPHCKDFFGFVENRSSGLPRWTLESSWFYGKSLSEDFLAWPGLTWPILLLAFWGACRLASMPPLQRILALYVMIHGAALWMHPYKLPRFAMTCFVPLVLLSAWGALDLLRSWVAPALRNLGWRGRQPRQVILGLALAGTVCVVAWRSGVLFSSPTGSWGPHDAQTPWVHFAEQTVPPASRGVLDRILDGAEDKETALLGTWNLFSPSLVEWRRLQRGRLQETLWLGRDLERLRRKGVPWPQRVIVLELEPARWRDDLAQAYLLETERHRQWAASLGQSGEYQVLASESWSEAGYRLKVLERVPSVGPAKE